MTGYTDCEAIDPGSAKPALGLGGVVRAALVALAMLALPAVAQAAETPDPRAMIRDNCTAWVQHLTNRRMSNALKEHGSDARASIYALWHDQCVTGEMRSLAVIEDGVERNRWPNSLMDRCVQTILLVPFVPPSVKSMPFAYTHACLENGIKAR